LEGVAIKGEEKELLKDIRCENWLSRQKELMVRAARRFR